MNETYGSTSIGIIYVAKDIPKSVAHHQKTSTGKINIHIDLTRHDIITSTFCCFDISSYYCSYYESSVCSSSNIVPQLL